MLTWWTIANSSQRFSSNPLSHAIVPGDDKIKFYQSFANWLEYWSSGSCNFCFTKQTVNALIWTLRSQALLFTELLDINKYEYVIPRSGVMLKWPYWKQVFPIPSNEWRKISCKLEGSQQFRENLSQPFTTEGWNKHLGRWRGKRNGRATGRLSARASATWRWNYKSVFVWKCTWCSGSSCWLCSDKIALPIPLWKLRRCDGPTREKWQHKQIFRCSFTWRVNCAFKQSSRICLQLLRHFRFCRNCN